MYFICENLTDLRGEKAHEEELSLPRRGVRDEEKNILFCREDATKKKGDAREEKKFTQQLHREEPTKGSGVVHEEV